MTKIVLLLLLLNLIKSNQFENHTSTYVFKCQSISYCNDNSMDFYCGNNCTNIRYCYTIDDYYENYFDNKNCDHEDKIINFNKKEYFKNFEVETREYLENILRYYIIIIIAIYLIVLVSILTIIWICSFKINKNLSIYQYLTSRYYLIYRLFGINIEMLNKNEDIDEYDGNNERTTTASSSKSLSSASTSNLSKKSTGFEIKLLNKLYAKNKLNLKLLKSKNDEKLKLLNDLIDSGILIKFEDVDETFEMKKFDNNLMTQKVLNLHQYIENIRKIKIK